MSSRRLITPSERSKLDPFVVATGDASPRDQRNLMERPFFSLAKAKRTRPILYEAGDIRVEVYAVSEHGMATIWDADVLIWAASQIVEAENLGLKTSRFLRFTPYQLLTAVGRRTGARDYKLLKGALARLQATVIRTTIRQGEHWRRHQFSWINEWEECAQRDGRVEGMELVLPDWFYRGVIDRSLVLTIDPAYFSLTGGIERWLYRVARKHAGRQPKGWLFEIAHLHRKSGSLVRVSDFALQIRRIAVRQPLPGYQLHIEREARSELLRIVPSKLSTSPVDSAVEALGTSHANSIGIPHAALSGLRPREPQLTLWPETVIPDLNIESNVESNRCSGPARLADNAEADAERPTKHLSQPSLPLLDRKTGGRR
ncbi:plasmid replication initiation protein [Bradyrhizobium japonicum]|uniref:Plasmid replication initiation protein n=1 Tax=Bradyrhizobium elkanii TaxID=29448 RepID=A0ABV4FDH6_BRAEL|nr:replication initiator protein A [Bradyrhizobium elkanii]MBP2431581.1 plasmid replication initiation protein [Bradyrhizobium elkanii]MCP1734784.1 plasmid replication initiation protein [Bradyrhizobium elkanii]MCP1752891.1 plasmid replication initiation protein [Bradyrhizobium elkanii]MCP1975362.1 plasmid replication initiation protein [Bradyrhizobium elkanii]MCS3570123.1 plasmid replication initiation protein [Bradyrhizobium elkanii]